MNLGGEPVNDSFDPESDRVPQITYKTLTEHVTGHVRSALKVLLSSACFRGDALDNAETFLCDTCIIIIYLDYKLTRMIYYISLTSVKWKSVNREKDKIYQ